GEANWPITAYCSGLILGVLWLVDDLRAATGWYKRLAQGGLVAACGIGLLLSFLLHASALAHPLLAPLAGPVTLEQPFPFLRLDPTCRLRGGRTRAAEVDRLRRQQEREPVLTATGWSLPGLVGFYCDDHPTCYSIAPAFGDRRSQYDFWRPNPISD